MGDFLSLMAVLMMSIFVCSGWKQSILLLLSVEFLSFSVLLNLLSMMSSVEYLVGILILVLGSVLLLVLCFVTVRSFGSSQTKQFWFFFKMIN